MSFKGQVFSAASLEQVQASQFFPYLSSKTQKNTTINDFEKKIVELLIKSGDLSESSIATSRGEQHGFRNSLGSRYTYDENSDFSIHALIHIVYATEQGEEYLWSLIRAEYPDTRKPDFIIANQEKMLQESDSYKKLEPRTCRILKQIIKDPQTQNPYFLVCDDKYLVDVYNVLQGYQKIYYDIETLPLMTFRQACINILDDCCLKDKERTWNYLTGPIDKRKTVLFARIEYIQEFGLEDIALSLFVDLLRDLQKKNIKVIFTSLTERERYWQLDDRIQKIIDSAIEFYLCQI